MYDLKEKGIESLHSLKILFSHLTEVALGSSTQITFLYV